MIIILDEEWYIEDDGNGFTLTQEVMKEVEDKKTGEKSMKLVQVFQNYPPTLESCITHYVRRSTVSLQAEMTLKGYVNEICEKYGEVLKAIKGEK